MSKVIPKKNKDITIAFAIGIVIITAIFIGLYWLYF